MFESLKVSARVLPCWELRASRLSLRSAAKESMQFDVKEPLRRLNSTRDRTPLSRTHPRPRCAVFQSRSKRIH